MSHYLPIIISGIIVFTALMWWLLALGSVTKTGAPSVDTEARTAVPAPPVVAAAPAKLMDDPKPTAKTAPPKPQAPLKAAATKAAPAKAAKPVAKSAAAPKAATSKAATTKVALPKPVRAALPKATTAATPNVAAAPKAAPKGAAKAAPKTAAKPAAKAIIPNNLELLKGVGPKLATMMKSLGVTSFDQIANWTPADIAEIDSKLGTFAGRIGRDNWVDQAKLLVAGDVAGFEKKYGALGSEIAKG